MTLVAQGRLPESVTECTKGEVEAMISTIQRVEPEQFSPTFISQVQAIALAAVGQSPPCSDPMGIMHPPRGAHQRPGPPTHPHQSPSGARPPQGQTNPGRGQGAQIVQRSHDRNRNDNSGQGSAGGQQRPGQVRPPKPRWPCPICHDLLTNVPPHFGDACPLAIESRNLLIRAGKLPAPNQHTPQPQALLGWTGQDVRSGYYDNQSFNFPPGNSFPALPAPEDRPRGTNFMIVASLGGEDGSCPIPEDGWDAEGDNIDDLIRSYHSLATAKGTLIDVPAPAQSTGNSLTALQDSFRDQIAEYTEQGNRLLSQFGQAISAANAVEFVKARRNQFPLSFSVDPKMGRSQSRRPILAEQQEFPARLAPPEQAGLIIPQSPGVNPNLSVSPAASASRHNPLPTAEASTAASVRDTRLHAVRERL